MKANQVQAEKSECKKRVDRCGRWAMYKDEQGNAEIWRGGTQFKEGSEYQIGREWIKIKEREALNGRC